MKRALDDGDKEGGYRSFTSYLFRVIGDTVFIPEMQGLSHQKVTEATLEKKKEVYDILLQWWQKHKDSTYWHPKIQMLVAKGQSPDELREAAEKKQRQEIAAKLNAPLKPDKELVVPLVQLFEVQTERQVKERTENMRAFEKVDGGVWKMQWRQYVKGAWSDVTIRGPQLEKTSSKRYPLVAKFTKHAVEQGSGKSYRVMDAIFYYDKLHDRWVYGELPKE
jgi:hypothetical protein